MTERFSNRDPGARQVGVLFMAAAAILGFLNPADLFNPASRTQGLAFLLLAAGILCCFQSYTEIEVDDGGITIVRGRGRGRKLRWQEVMSWDVSVDRHWSGGKRPSLKVSNVVTLRVHAGEPLVLRDVEPHAELVSMVTARTGHRPEQDVGVEEPDTPLRATPVARTATVPHRDGIVRLNHGNGARGTIGFLVVLVVACAIAGHFAPFDPADPDSRAWWWGLTLIPAMVLGPFVLLMAWAELGSPAYTLSASGDTFTVVRRRFGRERTTSGDWSRITESRYEIEKRPGQDDFVLDAGQSEPLVFESVAKCPELVVWFNERAPLDYEWIPSPSVGDRRVLETVGGYSRVPRERA